MWLQSFIILFIFNIINSFKCEAKQKIPKLRKFPKDFKFGAATSAYQIEGAWNVDGKSINIWDELTHTSPCTIADCSSGDFAADSYHNIKRDVEMMRELGLDYYRFSISWTRILPTSFPDNINKAGVKYYNDLINEMLKYNIQPMVTLYHFDLPQKLQEMGGWLNPYMINWFGDYARVAFKLFGDRVKLWTTINEPNLICQHGYGNEDMAPRLNSKGFGEYICTKNVLLAHAKAYHVYDKEFRNAQNGSIFIALAMSHYEPVTENDKEAAEDANQFEMGLYAHPIFSTTGDYPLIVKGRIATKSAEQGLSSSRLIELTEEEVKFIKGTSDVLGVNHYTTSLVKRNESVNGLYDVPSFLDDRGVIEDKPCEWTGSVSPWLKVVPWGFYKLLTKIRAEYNNPIVYITENGFPSYDGLVDDDRINYYRKYLSAMLDAIHEGSNIKAYTAWSLMDNFEWMNGYNECFGLYEVDFDNPKRTRTPRKSAFVYKEILRSRVLDFNYEPNNTVMAIDLGH